MNDDMLSPSEIEALLKGELSEEREENTRETISSHSSSYPALTVLEQKTLNKLSSQVLASLTDTLTSLLRQHTEITMLETEIVQQQKLSAFLPERYAAVSVTYAESFLGTSFLLIQEDKAELLAQRILGNSELGSGQMTDFQREALQKAVQQSTKRAADFTSRFLGKPIHLVSSPVSYFYWQSGEQTAFASEEEWFVKFMFQLEVGEQMVIDMLYLLPLSLARDLAENAQKAMQQPVKQEAEYFNQQVQMPSQAAHEPLHVGGNVKSEEASAHIETAVFSSFQPQQSFSEKEVRNLNMLFDIPLQVTVELGRTSRSVKEILEWTAGSIIELDKLAGEPVDVLVNNKLVAKGEVVVIDESFGVRITTIASPTDRLKNIN